MEKTLISLRTLLVVSRDASALAHLTSPGGLAGWKQERAGSGWEALERVQAGSVADLVILDLERGDADGLHTLRWLRRVRPDLAVVILSYSEDPGQKAEALRLGAQEFLLKPIEEKQLQRTLERHMASLAGHSDSRVWSDDIEHVDDDVFFVAASPAMRNLRAQAELLSQVNTPLLIVGESGSGKEVAARLIHKLSVRSGFRFIKVNCAALPGGDLENELFGSPRSSSSFARQESKFEQGEKGTIFLDEITELPLMLQSKLLQVLQEKNFSRFANGNGNGNGNGSGNGAEREIDVRILAATDANIEQAIGERKLREDLYYRLSAFSVYVPSLRQRREDIPLLLAHFMNRLARHYGMHSRPYSAEMMAACQGYAWPGNLRELESFVKRYLVVGDQELAVAELARKAEGRSGYVIPLTSLNAANGHGNSDVAGNGNGISIQAVAADEASGLKSLVQNIKGETERNAIAVALEQTGWNRKAASRLLKVSYRTLLYKIQHYHMSPGSEYLPPEASGNGELAHGGPVNGIRPAGGRTRLEAVRSSGSAR